MTTFKDLGLFSALGFSPKETAVYLALLELGPSKATAISKKTDLNRATTYGLLDMLREKGLVSTYKRRSATFFTAQEPDTLLTYLDHEEQEQIKNIEQQKKLVKASLPQLISLQNISNSKPRVQFFEGEKGMREAYEDTLTTRHMILAYANVQTVHEALPRFFPDYYQRRAKKHIFIRAIFTQNKISKERALLDREEMRETRFLPRVDQTFTPEVNIYDNKILVASWKERVAVILESKELADLQRLIFQLVWDGLPRTS